MALNQYRITDLLPNNILNNQCGSAHSFDGFKVLIEIVIKKNPSDRSSWNVALYKINIENVITIWVIETERERDKAKLRTTVQCIMWSASNWTLLRVLSDGFVCNKEKKVKAKIRAGKIATDTIRHGSHIDGCSHIQQGWMLFQSMSNRCATAECVFIT